MGLCGLVACTQPDPPPAAPLAEGTSFGSGASGPPSSGATTSGDDPAAPAACEIAAGDAGGDETGSDGFKFDVGGGAGPVFPVTCDRIDASSSNVGCEFWAVDLPNDYRGTPMSPPAADQQYAIVVANASSLAAANVEVFVGADEVVPVASITVPPDGVQEIPLDPLSIDASLTTDDGTAYHIVSDVPITAYQFNPLDNTVMVYSNDASLLLPAHTLAADYIAVTGDAILLSMSEDDPAPVNAGAFVSVVATVDNTSVDIDATATLVGGASSAVIDRGEVFTIISDGSTSSGNLTGSRIVSSDPVAVFAGNVATAVPSGAQVCCADHVEHQLPPIEAWGTAYAVAPPPSPSGESDDPAEYRIVAAYDDTELTWCPARPDGAPEQLMAGQSATFVTDQPFSVVAAPDRPFAVAQFLLSFTAIDAAQPGDPAMIVIPSIEQGQYEYVFVVPAGYAKNFVTIGTRGGGGVALDGEAVGPLTDLGVVRGQLHHYGQFSVGVGAHTIESDAPAAITVVGYDEAVSYGYPGGAGLRVIAIPPVAG